MLYTLAKFFVWALGFALLGAVVGWLLRAIRCRQEVAEERATTVDQAEVERLRHRVANLEPIVNDRDALRQRVLELEGERKAARVSDVSPVRGFAGVGSVSSEGTSDSGTGEVAESAPAVAAVAPTVATDVAFAPFAGFGVAPDLGAARELFGKAVALDDLKIVEGIGPVIEGVLQAGGITTWSGLGQARPDDITAILVGADDRHRMHDPTSWPRQARLAAIGEWEALKALQDRLTAGRH